MKNLYLITLAVFCLSACSGSGDYAHEEEATVASETGQPAPLPADVIYVARPLISGKLYSQPDFEAGAIAYFDTTQRIFVLDTSNAMFVKARIRQDTSQHTGFVPKTILPDRE
ncbi:hypothetical protein [Pontibacter anaerobius]|uniref:SH3 domain-containing protein n=1 Tax=Pontibacter anaerobius TaxID=2993940 RepID=A0ABT3RHF8_9BACT|nr:hypothetical protein [Pontibacter anaerobius]MCX2741251.1 hypothetical protein [Pontibacter anaerobius]